MQVVTSDPEVPASVALCGLFLGASRGSQEFPRGCCPPPAVLTFYKHSVGKTR